MPDKYTSPACNYCGQNSVETQIHRLTQCQQVSEAWLLIQDLILSLDFSMVFETDHSLICLYFSPSIKETDILWLLGEYVVYVENEAVLKNRRISHRELLCHSKSRFLSCNNLPISNLKPFLSGEASGVG